MTEHLPSREQPTDDQLIHLGIQYAVLNDTTIPDSTARRIAMQWHGGQASALYSLGSCGAIDLSALVQELGVVYVKARDEHDQLALNELARYVEARGERDELPGWYRTTADGLPAVVDVAGEQTGDYIGGYPTKRAVAEDLLAATGIWRAMNRLFDRCGYALKPYVQVDIDRYEVDLSRQVVLYPTLEGTVDAYWRID